MKKALIAVGFLGVVSFFLAGCTTNLSSSNSSQSQTLEQNQESLVKAVPLPKLEDSQERKNISERAQLFNNQNKTSYIYLVNYGKIMAFYTVRGKVSSLRSYMSPQEQIVNNRGIPCQQAARGDYAGPSCGGGGYIVQAPDVDGSYGDNTDGVFFFTTDGAYVEWKGDYMMSDQPLKLTTPPELIREIK